MWQEPRVSIYRNCEGFKNAENHTFEKLTKFAKLQYFEPFYFLKWKKELTEIDLTVMYHYCTLYNRSKIV